MLKLMKYEFRKTRLTKMVWLIITAIAEALFLFGLYTDRYTMVGFSVFALTILALLVTFILGLESIVTLHRDMNTKQSYMLFMTPHSCYSILGAKTLECGISILAAGVFFFALGALDISLLFAREGKLADLWQMIQEVVREISINGRAIEIDASTIASVVFVLLASWLFTVVTAYLAVVISAAILNGKRFNGLICLIFFLAITLACSYVFNLITRPIPGNIPMMMVYGLTALIFSAIMYVITAKIMEDKLSV